MTTATIFTKVLTQTKQLNTFNFPYSSGKLKYGKNEVNSWRSWWCMLWWDLLMVVMGVVWGEVHTNNSKRVSLTLSIKKWNFDMWHFEVWYPSNKRAFGRLDWTLPFTIIVSSILSSFRDYWFFISLGNMWTHVWNSLVNIRLNHWRTIIIGCAGFLPLGGVPYFAKYF